MDSTIEDILEKRIAELEKQVFGLERKPDEQSKLLENPIIESIENVNTLFSTALSGREKINALIERFPELENYMESDFEPVDMQIDSKLEYILAMEPEIRENAQRLNQLKELLPVLESDRFKNLPEMTEKLNNLSLKYLKLGEQAEEVNTETRIMISRYNDIITNISKTIIAMDNQVTELEKAAIPENVTD